MEKSLTNLSNFLSLHKIEILCIQETRISQTNKLKHWQQQHALTCFHNSTTHETHTTHAGTAIIMPTRITNEINPKTHIILSNYIHSLKFSLDQSTYLLINCYLPSGNSAINIRHRTLALNTLSTYLETQKFDHLIIAGDFNMVMSQLDKANPLILHQDNHTLAALLKSYSLTDSYRHAHPKQKCFSYTRSNTASRIDRIYISHSLQKSLLNSNYNFISFSDHTASPFINLKSNTPQTKSKRSWKLNNSLLDLHEYRPSLLKWIEIWKNKPVFAVDPLKWWEDLKKFIKNFYLLIGQLNKHKIQNQQAALESQLQLLNPDTDQIKIFKITNELKSLNDLRHRGAQVRARPNIWLENEELSQNYFEMEKRKQHQQSLLPSLILQENPKHSSLPKQETVFAHFYEKWSTPPKNTNHTAFLKDIKPLSEDSLLAHLTNPLITPEEVLTTIQSFREHTAPGSDGLTIEFYKTYAKTLSPILSEIYNNTYINNTLTQTQKSAHVKLIPKSGPLKSISNWRPISLLNSDYKILAKIIARRLTPLLNEYISPNQQCGLPGRQMHNIHQNLLAAIQYSQDIQNPITILQLDFSKAFDSLSHSFIFSILHKINLPDTLIKWISILLNDVHSQIIYNDSLSPKIPQKKGIRQGCPLSMLLFILSTDILNQKITQDPSTPGIKLSRNILKIQQYADDTTIILNDNTNIHNLHKTLSAFGHHSNLILNNKKCKFISNSTKIANILPNLFPEIKSANQIKILGIFFSLVHNNSRNQNWKNVISKIRNLAFQHQSEKLSMFGKIKIINGLFLPHIIMLARIIFPSMQQINTIKHIFYKFLWHPNYLEPMNRAKLTAHHKDGGCSFPDPKYKIEAAFAMKLISLFRKDTPNYFYCQYAKYNLNYHIKQFDDTLFSRNSPHRPTPNTTWKTTMSILHKIKTKINTWSEVTFRSLYWTIADPTPNPLPKINATFQPKSWTTILLRTPKQEFFSPKEKEIAFRVAHNAYLWGSFNAKIFTTSQHPNTLLKNCPLCQTHPDFPSHFFYDCQISRTILSNLQKQLSEKLTIPVKLNKNLVLFNTSKLPKNVHIAATKLCSIFRRNLLGQKLDWNKHHNPTINKNRWIQISTRQILQLYNKESDVLCL